jgi:hypothetical protein
VWGHSALLVQNCCGLTILSRKVRHPFSANRLMFSLQSLRQHIHPHFTSLLKFKGFITFVQQNFLNILICKIEQMKREMIIFPIAIMGITVIGSFGIFAVNNIYLYFLAVSQIVLLQSWYWWVWPSSLLPLMAINLVFYSLLSPWRTSICPYVFYMWIYWSERSACDQRSNLGGHYFR